MNRHPISESRAHFIEEHGGREALRRFVIGKGERKVTSRYYIFPDGAKLDQDPMGENFDPPADEAERLKLILAYRLIIHAEKQEAHQQCQNMILAHFDPNFRGTYCGPVYHGGQDDALKELRQKRNEVWNAKDAIEQVEQALDTLISPPSKVKQREKLDQQIAMQDMDFWDKFRELTV